MLNNEVSTHQNVYIMYFNNIETGKWEKDLKYGKEKLMFVLI